MDKENIPEKAVLIGLATDGCDDFEAVTDESMDELEELLKTAGGVSEARVIQRRVSPEPRTFIGAGKALEIADIIKNLGLTLAVFDNELSPAQTKNLEEILNVRVIDRSTLILDIFASRAQSREGKLQVELAQYKYLLPRLSGRGAELSRLGGGIGTRGPGETKLETDRRHIRRRIARLETELETVMRVRGEQRRARIKREIPLVALIGYTNAGKSTLLNALTGSNIHAQNRLFDTLDPTARRFSVSDTAEVILSDTVGFIRKLPHHLTRAFRATLEELLYADLVLHVVDASSPQLSAQVRVVENVVRELGAADTPSITVLNKCDLLGDVSELFSEDGAVCISAKNGTNFDMLKEEICRVLSKISRRVTLEIPYGKSALVDLLHREGRVLSLDYRDDCVALEALCDDKLYSKVMRELGGSSHDKQL